MEINSGIATVLLLSFAYLAVNVLLIVGAIVAIDSPYILPSCRDARKKTGEKRHA